MSENGLIERLTGNLKNQLLLDIDYHLSRKYTLHEDYVVMCVSVVFCSSVDSTVLFEDDSIYIYISSLCEGIQNYRLALSNKLTPFYAHPRIRGNLGMTLRRLLYQQHCV